MNETRLEALQEQERESWRTSALEGVHSDAVENLLHKMSEARIFLEGVRKYQRLFDSAQDILELGGGEGWASCLLKRVLPGPRVILASDIAEAAIGAATKWEHVFRVTLDRTFACLSYEIPVEDESVDLVFAFQAAHHFVAHRRTFREVRRVLRPGGSCLYLHEPTCRGYAYPLYRMRARRVGSDGPEDVLDFPRLMRLAAAEGLRASWDFDLTLTNRSPTATLYYLTQRKIPLLRHVMPGTKHFVFEKPK